MMNKLKEFWQNCDRFLLTMLLAGVLLRIIYLIEYSQYINFNIAVGADVREYFDRATEIISGRIFPEKPDIHGVLYPLVISPILALTESVAVLRTVQMILNVLSFAGLYFLLGKYQVSQAVRKVFITIAMLYTVPFFHAAELISETLLLPLAAVLLYMLYFMRKLNGKAEIYAGFAGVISAFMVLTHGSMLLMPLLFGAELFREKRRRCAWIFLIALCAVVGSAVTIKSVHYGKFCFVQANGGFNFYLGNSPSADGTCRIRPGMTWRKTHLAAEKEAAERKISTDALFIEKSLKYMVENPFRAAAGFVRKALMFFHYKELIAGADPSGLLYRTYTVKVGKFFTLAVMLFAAIGAFAVWKKKEKFPFDFAVLLIAVFAVNVLTVTSGRYRYAAYPSLYLLAAYAVVFIPQKVTAVVSVICLVPALLFPYGNTLDFESRRILGEAAYRKHDFASAYNHLTLIRQKNDDPSGVENMLGDIYERRGDKKAARECYQKAIELEPERFEAYMNLAKLVSDPQESEKLYRKAFETGGKNSGLLYVNYAKFLLSIKRPREAVETALNGTHLLPKSADAWNTLAVSYAYSGNIRLAMESFETASVLAPDNANYRRNAEIMRQELQRRFRHFHQRHTRQR